MNVLHVEVEGGNRIRNWIFSKFFSLILSHLHHVFRVHLNRFILKLSSRYSFQASWSLREISVSIDPVVAVKVAYVWTIVLPCFIVDAHDLAKIKKVVGTSSLNKRVVKFIAIEAGNNRWLVTFDDVSKGLKNFLFWTRIVNLNMAFEFWFPFWFIVKFINFLLAECSINDEHCFTLKHDGNHHN